ncbi:hypothetical protein D9M71_596380 [compost metagenome]
MAGDAAVVLEALVAVFFLQGKRLGIALQVTIEARARGKKRPLVIGQRAEDVVLCHRVRVGILERLAVMHVCGDALLDHAPVSAHLVSAGDHGLPLLLE